MSGAYLSGKRSRQIFIGGSESLSVRIGGHWLSGKARASVTALIQVAVFSNQRARRPIGRRTFSKSFFVLIGFSTAFVVAFLDGERINLEKGIKLAQN